MTKEKIIKLCEKYINNKDGFMTTSFAHKLLLLDEQEKADLLKEFTEFVEDKLTIWIKDENYQANIAEAENDNLRKNMSLLIAETIEAIKNSMKPTLEKFLEKEK